MWKKISAESYHNEHSTYLGSSDLRRILRSPAHYRLRNNQSTPAQEFGTLVHAFALEPDLAEASYLPSPDVDRRTKEGKQAYAEAERFAQVGGARLVRSDDLNAARDCAASVQKAMANAGLSRFQAEISGFAEYRGVNCKIRPDGMTEQIIIDLKTTQDPLKFDRSLFEFGYHIQASFYLDISQQIDGWKRDFVWVVVESKPPYGVMIFEPSQDVLNKGRELYQNALEIYKRCVEWDHWPAFDLTKKTIELPRWQE